jgi:hypothetical protein
MCGAFLEITNCIKFTVTILFLHSADRKRRGPLLFEFSTGTKIVSSASGYRIAIGKFPE